MTTILRFDNVSKAFENKPVLNKLSFELTSGMVVGLLGKNGAGKSTLMRCALGIIRADQGKISVLSDSPESLSQSSKERIGYVPQTPFGYEGFTVAGALDIHRNFYPNWDNELEQNWLARFDLPLTAQVHKLSVGQRQSLAIIMAMAYRPQLLILDEPVASLDPVSRKEFMQDLFDLALDSGSAVIFSSHITSDLERVASHLALLKDGELIMFKELDEVRENVRLIRIDQQHSLPSSFEILHRSTNKAIVVNYQGESLDSAQSIESLNLEQLFMELHG